MSEGRRLLRLTVLVGESDQWHHRPVYAEIVHRARDAGLAGASVPRVVPSSTPARPSRSRPTVPVRRTWPG
ncbi:DUF190 domain-containing protein [Georgenia sp. 1P01AC]|uniref:DUF190 domain-containing protein n=1 Tax=unclassified Georgenia TaxID=2626815 RepID=UPI0039AEB7B6